MSDISDEEDEVRTTGREGIIFLVDATESMFREDESGNCAFKQSLKACDDAMMHKVKFSDNDLMGFILFGTDSTRNDGERSHISVLKGLQRPCSDTVRELRRMHESSTIGDFGSKFGHNEDYLFADVLWLAQSMFSKHARNLVSSRIILLSSSKRFGKDDNHSQLQARKCANDLHGHSISMDFVPCTPEYKPTDFISTIMQIVRGNNEPWTVPRSHAINSLEDLPVVVESVVDSKGEHTRYFAHLNFCIGGKVSVGVEIYNLMRAYGGPKKEKLCRVTNKKVSSKVVHQVSAVEAEVDVEGEDEDSSYKVADEPNATIVEREQVGVEKADLDKSLHIGGETVRFTQEEFEMFYKIVDPGLVLLGFVPVDLLKITHHSGPASLVYPSRSSSSGSRDLFTALWHRMGEKNVAAVCTCTLRKRSLTRFAALVPSGLEKDNKVYDEYKKYGIHAMPEPQGFHIFYFPFTDYINTLGIPGRPSASSEQVSLAVAVLKKLRFIFHPSRIPDPAAETQWAAIEAIALESSSVRVVVDEIRPDYEVIDERLGDLAMSFARSVYRDDYDPLAKVKKKSSGVKVSSQPFGELDRDVVEAAIKSRKVETLNMDKLKGYLKTKGIPVSGKRKQDLVDAIYALRYQ